MKKITALILALATLCTVCGALAEKSGGADIPRFETVREANEGRTSGGATFICEDTWGIVMLIDGRYYRFIALLDEEAKKLHDDIYAIPDAESAEREAAREAFLRYIDSLPITIAEEITDVPLTEAELDAMTGKTLKEIQSALYDPDKPLFCDPLIYTMAEGNELSFALTYGFFQYELVINESYDEYLACEDHYDNLTVKRAGRSGFSTYAAYPEYLADGTKKPFDDEFPSGLKTVRDVEEAVGSRGTNSYYGEDWILVASSHGRYFRFAAAMDEKARKLYSDYAAAAQEDEIEPVREARNAFDQYFRTLPLSVAEELTVLPLTQEELDALTGKTLAEVQSNVLVPNGMPTGYSYCTPGEGRSLNFRLEYGFYEYEVEFNEPDEEVYQVCETHEGYDTLTVKSARWSGFSYSITDLDYLPDGTQRPDAGTAEAP